MKKFFPIIVLCLLFFACREETIPVVSVEMLPEELVRLSADTTFDTIPFIREDILRDTFYVDSLLPDTLIIDSISIDTLRTDTFYVDTFYIDTLRLRATVAYAGENLQGPTLQEYGFCVNNRREDDTVFYPVWRADALPQTPGGYGEFAYVLTARNTDLLYVYAYAVNPFGTVNSFRRLVTVADHDSR